MLESESSESNSFIFFFVGRPEKNAKVILVKGRGVSGGENGFLTFSDCSASPLSGTFYGTEKFPGAPKMGNVIIFKNSK